MYRVILFVLLAAPLAACSLNSNSIGGGLGYADDPATASITQVTPGYGLGSGKSAKRRSQSSGQQLASLDDQAPKGSYESAPVGALADRDYSKTELNVGLARDLINQYRQENGLQPLTINSELTKAAKAHSRDLAKWDRISHYGSDGSNPWDRVKRTGYKPRLAAENVGTGQASFQEVLKGWKDSAGHNKNLLLSDARHMGLALVSAPNTEFKSFWTLVVGSAL